MTTTDLLNAHTEYTSAYVAWEAEYPFDLLTAMDRPEAPQPTSAQQAGQLIATYGVQGALAYAVNDMLNFDLTDKNRAIYQQLIWAVQDGE